MAQWEVGCNAAELDASRLLAAAQIARLPSRIALAEVAVGCWRFARALGPRPDALLAFAEGVHAACVDDRRNARTASTVPRCEKCSRVRDTMHEAAELARGIIEPWLFVDPSDVGGLR